MAQPPEGIARSEMIASIDHVIRTRRTWKVLATCDGKSNANPQGHDRNQDDGDSAHERLIWESIETAGWAPFHYDRMIDGVAEPWRFYWIQCAACRRLANELPVLAEKMKPGNKMPAMLNACGSMIIVTWIPEPNPNNEEKRTAVNEEHLAATAAAVQNLLLCLEARGLGTYWSSGGCLRESQVAKHLGISPQERLIAALFVDDPALPQSAELQRIGGKNLEKRSPANRWCQVLK